MKKSVILESLSDMTEDAEQSDIALLFERELEHWKIYCKEAFLEVLAGGDDFEPTTEMTTSYHGVWVKGWRYFSDSDMVDYLDDQEQFVDWLAQGENRL